MGNLDKCSQVSDRTGTPCRSQFNCVIVSCDVRSQPVWRRCRCILRMDGPLGEKNLSPTYKLTKLASHESREKCVSTNDYAGQTRFVARGRGHDSTSLEQFRIRDSRRRLSLRRRSPIRTAGLLTPFKGLLPSVVGRWLGQPTERVVVPGGSPAVRPRRMVLKTPYAESQIEVQSEIPLISPGRVFSGLRAHLCAM